MTALDNADVFAQDITRNSSVTTSARTYTTLRDSIVNPSISSIILAKHRSVDTLSRPRKPTRAGISYPRFQVVEMRFVGVQTYNYLR